VKDFVQAVQSEGVILQHVILFGSFAKNHQHEWSDIDLALVSDSFSGFGFEDKQPFAGINARKPFSVIHAKTFPTADFETGDPFIDEIKKTGIVIFRRNPEVTPAQAKR
jgi:hypothetical protein